MTLGRGLADQHGRVATDLRVSLTDRCNLRCSYCMPAEGLDWVNVSLDTLDPARFAELTRRDRHADVLDGLAAAADAGLVPVKMNAVLMRGLNEDEAVPLLAFAL